VSLSHFEVHTPNRPPARRCTSPQALPIHTTPDTTSRCAPPSTPSLNSTSLHGAPLCACTPHAPLECLSGCLVSGCFVCVCVDKVSVALPCTPPPLDASGGVAGGHPHVVTTIIRLACVVSLSSCSSAAPLPTRSLPFVLRYGGMLCLLARRASVSGSRSSSSLPAVCVCAEGKRGRRDLPLLVSVWSHACRSLLIAPRPPACLSADLCCVWVAPHFLSHSNVFSSSSVQETVLPLPPFTHHFHPTRALACAIGLRCFRIECVVDDSRPTNVLDDPPSSSTFLVFALSQRAFPDHHLSLNPLIVCSLSQLTRLSPSTPISVAGHFSPQAPNTPRKTHSKPTCRCVSASIPPTQLLQASLRLPLNRSATSSVPQLLPQIESTGRRPPP